MRQGIRLLRSKGHTLVIPKKEVDYLLDLDDETYNGLFRFAKNVGNAIENNLQLLNSMVKALHY